MSYVQLGIILRSDAVYLAVETKAIEAEKRGMWLAAAKLRLYMVKRMQAIFAKRRVAK